MTNARPKIAQPRNASPFESWLVDAGQVDGPRRRSSAEVYRAIWTSFTFWCSGQRPLVHPLDATKRDLQRFLASRHGTVDPSGALSDRYTWTVLNLIDRVVRHAALAAEAEPNTAAADLIATRPSIRYANASDPALPDHLSAADARTLVTFLSRQRPRANKTNGGEGSQLRWQDLRNHASVALQLGAGLAPGDIRAMTLKAVIVADGAVEGVPWKLRVPADGNTPQREAPVARWAGRLLGDFLGARRDEAIPGNWLFPSTRTGKPWSKMAQYRAAQQVLADAGIDASDGGSFRLRHTFALRQLRRGQSPVDVARWMGIARLETLERYSRVLRTPNHLA